jgi:hypothetical protein
LDRTTLADAIVASGKKRRGEPMTQHDEAAVAVVTKWAADYCGDEYAVVQPGPKNKVMMTAPAVPA